VARPIAFRASLRNAALRARWGLAAAVKRRSIGRFQTIERLEKAVDVPGIPPMDDVEIQRQDGRPLQCCGYAAHHDEIDPVFYEGPEQSLEIRNRSRHGAASQGSPRLPEGF
jgi:hypothetical protein